MTDTTPHLTPAQVGKGRRTHYVRADGFHLKAIGCNRVIDRTLDADAAKKMTGTCKACAEAVEKLTATAQEATPDYETLEGVIVEHDGTAGRRTPGRRRSPRRPSWPQGRPSAPATTPEPEHCTPLMGGKVHEVMPGLEGSDGRADHVFPLCRTGAMTNSGTRYRKVTADLTCIACVSNRDRRRANRAG